MMHTAIEVHICRAVFKVAGLLSPHSAFRNWITSLREAVAVFLLLVPLHSERYSLDASSSDGSP
jgi:hypothetical protein